MEVCFSVCEYCGYKQRTIKPWEKIPTCRRCYRLILKHCLTNEIPSGTPLEGENNNKSATLVAGGKEIKQI